MIRKTMFALAALAVLAIGSFGLAKAQDDGDSQQNPVAATWRG
jgi:hypothetical protein